MEDVQIFETAIMNNAGRQVGKIAILAIALLINLLAGLLLFIASIDASYKKDKVNFSISELPGIYWWVVILFIGLLLYFIKRRFNLSVDKIWKRK